MGDLDLGATVNRGAGVIGVGVLSPSVARDLDLVSDFGGLPSISVLEGDIQSVWTADFDVGSHVVAAGGLRTSIGIKRWRAVQVIVAAAAGGHIERVRRVRRLDI